MDHLLDFSDTNYRVLKAFPSDPQELRALSLSRKDNQQLVLKWTPNGTARKASIFLRVMGPEGEQTITLLVKRSGNEPDNIRTAFVPSQTVSRDAAREIAQVPSRSTVEPTDTRLIRPDWTTQDPPPAAQPVKPLLALKHPKASPVIKLKPTPKPVPKIAKVSATGRTLIDRSGLSNHQLAHYLLKGLHNARGKKHISRYHLNYRLAQSMAIRLKGGDSVDRALRVSGLSAKSFGDFLGYGGVGK